jgi:hypothetical protein
MTLAEEVQQLVMHPEDVSTETLARSVTVIADTLAEEGASLPALVLREAAKRLMSHSPLSLGGNNG